MKKTSKIIAAGVGTTLAAVAAAQTVALADASPAGPVVPAVVSENQAQGFASTRVLQDRVVGTFGFSQNEVSSNSWMATHISGAAQYLCGSRVVATGDSFVADPASWAIEVSGDVANPYHATIGELAASTEVQSALMGCSCAANPADGLAVANALVEGISVTLLLQIAQPEDGANTLVFTSADGYEVALPFSYVTTRYCPLVFKVNGSDLVESVGGTNQLWLGSTPGNYFARDIVSIRVETRDVPPVDPTCDTMRSEYGNLPNVGIKFGGEIG